MSFLKDFNKTKTKMNLIELRYQIEQSWSRLTTYCPEKWSTENPAFYQCKVSSLLLYQQLKNQHRYACRIMKGMVGTSPHWWNEINGVPFDVSWPQFIAPNTIKEITECCDEGLLEEQWEVDCFNELKKNFTQLQFEYQHKASSQKNIGVKLIFVKP